MKITGLALLSMMLIAPVAGSQQGGIPGTNSGAPGASKGQPRGLGLPDASGMPTTDSPSPFDSRMESQRAKLRNEDRQKRLVDDTNKLLDLANQLKAEVDKSGKDTLSVTVIKRAEEIEKLAKSVKERMKG